MSAREYIEAYEFMTDKQKDIMQELWWGAVNHDSHAWVKENDVRVALYDLFINIRTEELPIINELFKDIQKSHLPTPPLYQAVRIFLMAVAMASTSSVVFSYPRLTRIVP